MTLTLFNLTRQADYERGVADRLITVREDGAGLLIHNYSDAALYTPGAWDNPAVRICRGLITREDGTVVARPWAKFFNHGQAEAGDLDLTAPVEVTDKMDGSLGIIHLNTHGAPRVASRGSFESDQARRATAMLANYPDLTNLDTVTPLVEIIYPANRIVVDYGDREDLVMLGGVVIDTGEYLGPRETAEAVRWTGSSTEVFPYATLRDALAAEDRPGMEGLCVRYLDAPRIVKIKQEDYVRLHRIVTGLSERTVWEHMTEGLPLGDLLGPLPDELHDWTRSVWDRIDRAACVQECKARDAHALILDTLPFSHTRKDYAELAKKHGPLTPLLFQILDGRDPRPAILKNLKPAGDTRAKAVSEAVA